MMLIISVLALYLFIRLCTERYQRRRQGRNLRYFVRNNLHYFTVESREFVLMMIAEELLK